MVTAHESENNIKKRIAIANIKGKEAMLKRRGEPALKIVKQIEDCQKRDKARGRDTK